MWYKGLSPKERKSRARFYVSNLIPEEPERIRMGDLIRQAREKYGISAVTVIECVKDGVEDDYYGRIEESHKRVYYQKRHRKGEFAKILMVPTLLIPLLEHTSRPHAWKKKGEAYVYSSKKKTEDGQIELIIRFKPIIM